MIDFREHAPAAPLDRWIERFWCLTQTVAPDRSAAPEKIVPDGRPELIFQLGAPYRQLDAPARQPRSFAVGQIRRWIEVVPTGSVELVGVTFRPHGLAALFGDSLRVLTDTELALEGWAPRGLVELEERLRDCPSWERRVALLETHLTAELERSAARRSPDPRLAAAVELIVGCRGRVTLDAVAARAGTSARTLERLFLAGVGIAPKLFARQVRFHHVFERLRQGPRPWSELALEVGCYDQAHLIREFRAFAGETPAAFLRREHALSNQLTGLVD